MQHLAAAAAAAAAVHGSVVDLTLEAAAAATAAAPLQLPQAARQLQQMQGQAGPSLSSRAIALASSGVDWHEMEQKLKETAPQEEAFEGFSGSSYALTFDDGELCAGAGVVPACQHNLRLPLKTLPEDSSMQCNTRRPCTRQRWPGAEPPRQTTPSRDLYARLTPLWRWKSSGVMPWPSRQANGPPPWLRNVLAICLCGFLNPVAPFICVCSWIATSRR